MEKMFLLSLFSKKKKKKRQKPTHRSPASQETRESLGVAGDAVTPSIDLAKDREVEESRGDRGPVFVRVKVVFCLKRRKKK